MTLTLSSAAPSVFDTFPWPQFSSTGRSRDNETQTSSATEKSETPHVFSYSEIKQIDAVAGACELRRVRAGALPPKLKGGLCALYRTLELTRSRPLARPSQGLLLHKIPFAVSQTAQVPGANPLEDAHAALDTAVLTAFGFSAKKELLAQLLALNQEVAA